MPRDIDVLTEGVIDAPPEIVFDEILKLFAGNSQWHFPNIRKKYLGGSPVGSMGAEYEVKILANPPFTILCKEKMIKKVDNQLLEFEQTGSFIGTTTWIIDSADGNKTRVRFRWASRAGKLPYKLIFGVIGNNAIDGVERAHRESVLQGFKLMEEHLQKNRK